MVGRLSISQRGLTKPASVSKRLGALDKVCASSSLTGPAPHGVRRAKSHQSAFTVCPRHMQRPAAGTPATAMLSNRAGHLTSDTHSLTTASTK